MKESDFNDYQPPAMFSSWSEARPLLLTALAGLFFWLWAFHQWPTIVSVLFAIGSGVTLSYGLGSWIRRSIERRKEERQFAEEIRREKIVEDLRDIQLEQRPPEE